MFNDGPFSKFDWASCCDIVLWNLKRSLLTLPFLKVAKKPPAATFLEALSCATFGDAFQSILLPI